MIPKEFFTIQSMVTLTGAAGATFIICNGLQKAFNFNPKWLALAIAIGLSFFGVYQTTDNKVSDYFVGLVNGFLIFCTAGGATELGGSKGNMAAAGAAISRGAAESTNPQAAQTKRQFLSSWSR
jgi:hypothetical protein